MLLDAKKWFIGRFLKICILSNFVTKLILQTSENLPENTNKDAFYSTAIQMKNSSKILKRRIVSKNLIFQNLNVFFFWGGGGGVTKYIPLKGFFLRKKKPQKHNKM